VFHPTCPVCRGMDATTFRASDVQTSLSELVPVRIDVTTAPEEIQRRLAEGRKWPYVAAVEGDGTTLEDLSGIWDLEDLPSRFAAAEHAVRSADPERPSWADVRAAAADLIAAETAEKEGRLGAAEEAAGRVARVAPDTLLADRAAWQVKKLDLAADEALARAADAAKSDVDAALRAVEQEAKRYEGSARGADFARVATAIRETGVFPALQEIRR